MADDFDPYYEWLGIPPEDRPPNHYRLLGIQLGESNPQVIANAAQRQAVFVGTYEPGPRGEHVPRLLHEIAAARACLLNPAAKSAYDGTLRLRSRHGLLSLIFGPASATEAPGEFVPGEHDSSPAWLTPAIMVGGTTLFVLVLVTLLATWVSTRQRSAEELVAGSQAEEDVELATSPAAPELAIVPLEQNAPETFPSDGPNAAPATEPVLAPDGRSNRSPPTSEGRDAGSAATRPVDEAMTAPTAAPNVRPPGPTVPPVADSEAKHASIRELLKQADQETDAPRRYALLDQARGLAAEAGDLQLSLSVIAELERRFEVATGTLTFETLKKLAVSVTRQEERRAVAQAAISCGERAADAGGVELAESLYLVALGTARHLMDAPLEGTIQRRLETLTPPPAEGVLVPAATDLSAAVTAQEVNQAHQLLQRNPRHADGHLTFGKFLCFVRGDWNMGLRHLAFGSDAKLSRLARDELFSPRTSKNLVDLADGWYDWGLEKNASTRKAVWSRALEHYQEAISGSAGKRRDHIDQRAAELTAALAKKEQVFARGQGWLAAPPGLVRSFEGHEQNITALAVSDDGTLLASAAEDRTVRLWDLGSGQEIWTQKSKTSHLNGVVVTPVLPDGRFVIANYDDSRFAVMSAADGSINRYAGSSPMSPTALRLTRDGVHLVWAARSRRPNLYVWNLAQDRAVGAYGDGDCPNVLALSRDGKRIATGDSRGVVRVWDLSTGEVLQQIRAHQDAVTDLDFSPSGQLVATAALNELCVFDLNSYEPVQTLRVESVRTVAFSPDGRRLASGGFREEVFVWDVATGRRFDTLKAETAFSERHITRIAFLPDPRGLVTGATGGKIRLWRLPN